MPLKIDFTKVKGLDPIPVGWYQGTIVKAEVKTSAQGNDYISLQWRVDGGEFDGRVVFDMLVFAENTLWRVKRTLQSLGFPIDFKGEIEPDDLVGRSADIMVEIEANEGIDPETGDPYPDRNRIKRLRALGSGPTSSDDLV